MRETFLLNARTFLGELRDEDAIAADLTVLRRVSAPVLLDNGDKSPAFFEPIIERLAEMLQDSRRNTLRGAGHTPQITHPDEYAATVSEFLLDRSVSESSAGHLDTIV